MNTMKRAEELLKGVQWKYRPYDEHWHIESGYYCPECGGKENDGHAENCELLAVITELDRMAQSEPVNHQMLEALKELRDAYQEFMGVPAVKANAAIAAAEESLTVERRAAPVNQQMLAEVVALLERHQKWLNKLPVPTAGATYQMMNVVGKAIDTLAGMAEENNRVEPVTRFCPDCGRVGSVGDEFKDCCPDGIHARMIPESMAKRCHDLFQIVVQGLKESASVPPGWKLVPVEPTLSMLIAWERAEQSSDRDVYRAILEAAPVPEGGA